MTAEIGDLFMHEFVEGEGLTKCKVIDRYMKCGNIFLRLSDPITGRETLIGPLDPGKTITFSPSKY
jgi:hypothetical protein